MAGSRQQPQPQLLGELRGDVAVKPTGNTTPGEAVAEFDWFPETGPAAGWQIGGKLFAAASGEVVIGEIVIHARDTQVPAGGITSGVLRDIPTGALMGQLRSTLTAAGVQIGEFEEATGDSFEDLRREAREAAHTLAASGGPKRGRKGYGDEHYRWVALEYLDLQGQGRGVLRRLADRASDTFGRPVAWQTVRDWVAEARRRGFLTQATPGRAGAQPGPNLGRKEQ